MDIRGVTDPQVDLAALPSLGVRASLADVVYTALRDAITSGTLAPGYHLREIPLSKHFAVSTTPIREALRRLEREGLVEVQPNRGAVVAAFDLPEILGLYEARAVLEAHAIRDAATRAGHDLASIEAILDKATAVLDEPDQVAFNELDVRFHRALTDLGGNAYIADLAERTHRQIQGVRVRCAVHLAGRPRQSHAEHLAMADAVRTHQPDTAEALARAHIHSVRDAVVGVLRTSLELADRSA